MESALVFRLTIPLSQFFSLLIYSWCLSIVIDEMYFVYVRNFYYLEIYNKFMNLSDLLCITVI